MIKLRVNPLFLLILVLFFLGGMIKDLIIAFSLVFLHELVHMITARKAGFKVGKIELFPFGGVAEYSGLIEMEPWQEIKVAFAGPLFNLILAGFFLIIQYLGLKAEIYTLLFKYNFMIGIFNLIPALPLDGGRVLRALLANKFGFKKGTLIAIKTAKTLAFIGGVIAVLVIIFNISNVWFLLLAFFVYGASIKEKEQVIYRLLEYLIHREEIVKDFKVKPVLHQVVRGSLNVRDIIYHINPTKYNVFYVLDSDLKITGIITETKLVHSFFQLNNKDLKVIDIV